MEDGFYSFNPDRIRDLQAPEAGLVLSRGGSNLASVLDQLAKLKAEAKKHIEEYLAAVLPGVQGVDARAIGPKETLEFRQAVAGSNDQWRYPAAGMSQGTLRALAVLTALHPAAAAVLLDALGEASKHTQVLVTSHSPELLDNCSIDVKSILGVFTDSGNTQVTPVDEEIRPILKERLCTSGGLEPDPEIRPTRHMNLFDAS